MGLVKQRVSIRTNQHFASLKDFASYLYQYPTMEQHIAAVEDIRNRHYTSTNWYSTTDSVVFEREWYKQEYLDQWLVHPDHMLFIDLCKELGWEVQSIQY